MVHGHIGVHSQLALWKKRKDESSETLQDNTASQSGEYVNGSHISLDQLSHSPNCREGTAGPEAHGWDFCPLGRVPVLRCLSCAHARVYVPTEMCACVLSGEKTALDVPATLLQWTLCRRPKVMLFVKVSELG